MTDNEIKKALELCGSEYECHNGCPYYNNGMFKCRDLSIYRDALDLINRLQAKKEALINGQETLQKYMAKIQAENERLTHITRNLIGEIKAEAYTEFADLLCKIWQRFEDENICGISNQGLVKFVCKEMVGEDNVD